MAFLLRDKADIKVFILYLLTNMERPVDFATLHDIVVQDEFVNSFDFMDCFAELCGTEAVEQTEKDGKSYYTVTEKGKAATEMLQSDILLAIREKALLSAQRMMALQSTGERRHSEVVALDNGKFRVDCECRDKGGVYMRTSVVVDTRRQAELMKYQFDDKAELVYRGIMSLLSGDVNYLADSWSEQ